MVQPGEFFESTRLKRWVLVPVLVTFAVWICTPGFMDEWTPGLVLLNAALASLSLLYASALLWPRRAALAARATAAGVFLFYCWYLAHELLFTDQPLRLFERRSQASPGNALAGLIVIGLPALLYAVRRRRREPE